MLQAQRLAQAENSPRIGQPPRNPGITDMDPAEVLAAARHEAAKVHQAVNDNGDLREPARAPVEQFRRLDEWLSDFLPLPEAWA